VGNAQGPQSVRRRCDDGPAIPETAVLDYEAIIVWIVIGGIAGWMAGLIVEGYGFGLFGNVVIGIIGAAIASLIMPLVGLNIETKLIKLFAATMGAIVLLLVFGAIRRR
jgi:uncharacterized membrane protein YeaQ/YmgE (transglycosylase-associated protein family)